MPVFGRFEELTGRAFRAHYSDDDPNRLLREEQVSSAEIESLPKDGVCGAGYVEERLSHMLSAT